MDSLSCQGGASLSAWLYLKSLLKSQAGPCLKNNLVQSSPLKALLKAVQLSTQAQLWLPAHMMIRCCNMSHQPFLHTWCYGQLALSTVPLKCPYIPYSWNNKVDLSCCSSLWRSLSRLSVQPSDPCYPSLLPLSSWDGGQQSQRIREGHTIPISVNNLANIHPLRYLRSSPLSVGMFY